LTTWTPSPWKASPCHVTLRKFDAISCHHCLWLQTCLCINWQNKQVSTTWESPIHLQEHKPAQPLGRLILPNKTE
jgi:hypothetical protein